jgi:uncharacterized protein (TIGR01777 family)
MKTVLITGGTGLIGRAITKKLREKGYYVIILTRKKPLQLASDAGITFAEWDTGRQYIERSAITRADYIIHLAGAGVAEKRWTPERKKEITDSRVNSSALLAKTLTETENKVKAVIAASAIGWYGPDSADRPYPFTETDSHSKDFLGKVCKQWEDSIQPADYPGRRLVKFRIGIVLSNDGGAIKEFKKPLRFGLAAIPGTGKQMVSWIYADDLVNMFIYAMENNSVKGTYNAVAPFPVSNKELVLTLAKACNWVYIPVSIPPFILKLMLGEMSIEVLKSATVSSKKIREAGFVFEYPDIQSAIRKLAAF